jgi:hypothetical protein
MFITFIYDRAPPIIVNSFTNTGGSMRKFQSAFIVLFLLLLGACTATTVPTTAQEATESPSAVPALPTVEVEAEDYCVSCHTDKEQLISNAKPIEVAESESKGVG